MLAKSLSMSLDSHVRDSTPAKADHLASVPTHLRYDIAVLYLQQSNYDLNGAVEAYLADEKWEGEHPMAGSSKAKAVLKPGRRKYGLGTGLSGQL